MCESLVLCLLRLNFVGKICLCSARLVMQRAPIQILAKALYAFQEQDNIIRYFLELGGRIFLRNKPVLWYPSQKVCYR